MNSAELHKRHAEVYERFFMSNEIAVSSPFLINRSGDLHPDFNGVSIKQKLPLRLYVGVQRNTTGRVTLGSVAHYDYVKEGFDVVESPKDASYRDVLLQEIAKMLPQDFKGATINVLSEIPRVLGMGYNSILPLCLAATVMILKKSSTVYPFLSLPKEHLQNSLNTSNILKELLSLAMQLDPIVHHKMTYAMKISSFFDGRYPIVAFKDAPEHTLLFDHLQSVQLYGARIEELQDDMCDGALPFDFGVIVSDKPILRENGKNVSHMANVSPADKVALKKTIDIIMDGKKSKSSLPKFYNFLEKEPDAINSAYVVMLGAISMEILNVFVKLLCSHYSDELLATFFATINKIRYGNNIMRKLSPHFSGFIATLLSHINLPTYEFACFPNNTLVREGTLTYVSYSEKNRALVVAGAEKIKQQYPGSFVLYSSWADGIADRGFVVEQCVDEGIVSQYVANSSWQLEDDAGRRLVGAFDYLINKPDYDVILDLFNGKIYHKGEKLTSRNLSSQSATIELIRLLFSSPNGEISNKNMSHSSYSKNKNELSSKIVAPLEKRVKETTGKDFIIKATGSMTDYSVYMKYNNLRIAFVDKKQK